MDPIRGSVSYRVSPSATHAATRPAQHKAGHEGLLDELRGIMDDDLDRKDCSVERLSTCI